MKKLTGSQVRKMFIDFFISKNHMIEPGASLVPINDPTLLWINSGVAALKKYLDGREKPKCNRIANAQKCIRTNDIENVGKTSRHHTFFEMLGNWSIGDYFKEESLKMSWEFLTSPEWIGFDPDRIYVTIYPDDTESYKIWTEQIGLSPTHILKSYDNYWEIGEGPCGPDSEIYYDRGPKYDPQGLGERAFFEELENDRYIEVWNNVFSQYDAKEGVDRKDYKELPQKNIDTGMGLERLVCLIQDAETNFDTDLFLPIIKETEKLAKVPYSENKMAYRVIADHIRTCVFALSDGATFSNEGRGYVLRRVLRRAMRYARYIGIEHTFLYNLVDTVCDIMRDFYPYLDEKKSFVKKLILKEEESFLLTLSNGEKMIASEIEKAKDGVLSGDVVFKLYDTYGFPKEMTIESAEEKGLKVDMDGFNKLMEKQKELARSSRDAGESMHNQSIDLLNFKEDFTFTGYEKHEDESYVIGLFSDGNAVDSIDTEGDVVFRNSCFYAESGGQCADTGYIDNDTTYGKVTDVKKAPNGEFLHHVVLEKGSIKLNDKFGLHINSEDRLKTMANHSSLHLLQSALRKVLGNHIAQAGSYVCKDYGRFDFSHYEKISDEDLNKIELLVNEFINKAYPVTTEVLDIDEAKKTDAIALFDEKYGDKVRVVSMGDVSKEFCGGTHVPNTANLGSFKINYEESIGSGIRRIECCTKLKSYEGFKDYDLYLNKIKDELKLKSTDMIYDRICNLKKENSELSQEISKLKERVMNLDADAIVSDAKDHDGMKYVVIKLSNSDYNLKDFASAIRNKLDGGLVFILNETSDKYSFVACLGKKAIEKGFKANELVSNAAAKVNGKGGGKPDMAQAGGANMGNHEDILNSVKSLLK